VTGRIDGEREEGEEDRVDETRRKQAGETEGRRGKQRGAAGRKGVGGRKGKMKGGR
jgi:hypothetical protein